MRGLCGGPHSRPCGRAVHAGATDTPAGPWRALHEGATDTPDTPAGPCPALHEGAADTPAGARGELTGRARIAVAFLAMVPTLPGSARVFGLVLAASSLPAVGCTGKAPDKDAPLGCTKDTDCKGDRVCAAGTCQDAPADAKPGAVKGDAPAQPPTGPQKPGDNPAARGDAAALLRERVPRRAGGGVEAGPRAAPADRRCRGAQVFEGPFGPSPKSMLVVDARGPISMRRCGPTVTGTGTGRSRTTGAAPGESRRSRSRRGRRRGAGRPRDGHVHARRRRAGQLRERALAVEGSEHVPPPRPRDRDCPAGVGGGNPREAEAVSGGERLRLQISLATPEAGRVLERCQ